MKKRGQNESDARRPAVIHRLERQDKNVLH